MDQHHLIQQEKFNDGTLKISNKKCKKKHQEKRKIEEKKNRQLTELNLIHPKH